MAALSGAGKLDHLAWVRTHHGFVSSKLEVYDDFAGTGRGLRATSAIAAGEVLVKLPRRALLSAESILDERGRVCSSKACRRALQTARSQGVLDDSDVLAIFLMWARATREQQSAELRAYLDALPCVEQGPAPLHSTLFWTDAELEWLSGTDCGAHARAVKQQLREQFGRIVSELFLPHPALFPLDSAAFTLREYKWATSLVWSRAMDFSVGTEGALLASRDHGLRAIVPFADLFNTDFEGPVSHWFVVKEQAVHVLAKQAFAAGEQVFINYNATSTSRSSRLYGFALAPLGPRLQHEAIELWAAMNPDDPRFGAAQQALRASLGDGVDPNAQPFLLTAADPLPRALLVALHCQRLVPLPSKEQQQQQQQPEWCPAVLRELETSLLERRASYWGGGDRAKDLRSVLPGAEPKLGAREHMAALVRLGELAVLDRTLKELRAAREQAEQRAAPTPEQAGIDTAAIDAMD
jgi:hypothetical protein